MKQSEREFVANAEPTAKALEFELEPAALPAEIGAAGRTAASWQSNSRDLDLRGMSRAVVLLRLRKALRGAPKGASVTLRCDDAGVEADLKAFQKLTSHSLRIDADNVFVITHK